MVGLKTVREKLLIPFVECLNVLEASGKKAEPKGKKIKSRTSPKLIGCMSWSFRGCHL